MQLSVKCIKIFKENFLKLGVREINYILEFLDVLNYQKQYSPKTIESYRLDLIEFESFLNREHLTFTTFKASDARNYLVFIYDKDYKKTTIGRKISAVRSFYHYLNERYIVEENPMANVPFPKKESKLPDFLYENQIDDLFQSLDENKKMYSRDRALLELLYGTGIRSTELLNIKLEDIDFDNRLLKVLGKGNKERLVPFNESTKHALIMYIDQFHLDMDRADAFWLNYNLSKLTDRGLRYIVNKIMKESAVKASLHPHTLRHTFATHMLNNGADIRAVQELLGHESLSTTQKYTHLSKEQLRHAYLASHPQNNKR